MKSKQAAAIFALLLSTFISAAGFFFVKKGIASLSPANLIFWRYLIATSILGLLSFSHIEKAVWKPGTVLGVLLLGTVLFQYIGLKTLPASTTSFVMGFAVVLVPLFVKSMNLRTWIAAFVALTGIGIISLHDEFSMALGWVLLGAVCSAGYIIFVGKYSNAHNLLTLNMTQCATICLLSVCIAWGQGSLSLPDEMTVWVYIIILATLNSVISIWLQFYAQRNLNHTTAAIIVSCEPIFATLIAVRFLSEHLTLSFYLGSSLLFAAIIISELKTTKPRAPEC